MDTSKENDNPNPMQKANPISVLFFTYALGMFKKGYYKTLDFTDIYNPLNEDRSKKLGDRLQKNWDAQLLSIKGTNKKPSFAQALVKTFWPEYLFLGVILGILELGFRIAQPIFLGNLLHYFRPDSTTTKNEAFYNAGALVAMNIGIAILVNQYIFRAFCYGMRVRAAVCSLIYRKALRLNMAALGHTASGKIVNLLSNDVSRFDLASFLINHMWTGPIMSCIVMYFLWKEAGYAGIVGVLPFFVIVPFQSYTGKLSSMFRRQTAYKTDERVRLMDEVINGIQVIKMYAWEKPFEKLIHVSRVKELKKVIKLSNIRGLYMSFNLITTRISLFSAILTMVLSGQEITAPTVFIFTCYFNILSQAMSSMFVRGISEIAELFVAIKRLQEFFLNEEYENTCVSNMQNEYPEKNNKQNEPNITTAVNLSSVTAKWDQTKSESALTNFTLHVAKGSLLCIIGPVGSGKSSLLQTILGELDVVDGDIRINGKVSYASQDAWIFAASIRQNIIFGSEYESKRYNQVIKVCALDKDFKQFDDGDKTVVGDRGASLSGGQKARINLARAIYRQADIYLLDDPLSAVDVHVCKHLYQECIEGFLKDNTRILVTHQVQHLKNAEHIIILKDGSIEAEGSFQSLSNNYEVNYAKIMNGPKEEQLEKEDIEQRKKIKLKRQCSNKSESSLSSLNSLNKEEDIGEQTGMLEETSKNTVEGSIFMSYMRSAGNSVIIIVVFLLYILAQLSASSVDYFVGYWADVEETRQAAIARDIQETSFNPYDIPNITTKTCLNIYIWLIIALTITSLTRSFLFYKLAMICSQKLHDNMFKSLIHTSMRFFETNPSGRILNRFSKDIGSIDEMLPKALLDAGQIMLQLIGSLILVAVVNPWLLLPLVGITLVFQFMKKIYLKSSTNIKRLEGVMRSPAFSHLNASIQGLTTIRAYGAQQILMNEFDKHQDLHTGAWFMAIMAGSAFGFYLDVLCLVFIGCVTFSFLFAEDSLGGQVGLAITQATAMTGFVQWGMRQIAEVINQLMSVERVLEYSNLEEEKQPIIPKAPPTKWPEYGKLEFKNMGLRYAVELNLALDNLNVQIQSMEKVGIVGRTGAGKSSLIAAIFRLAIIEGDIEIDTFNTENITLQTLRSKISIIPQDPVLFSGTLRYNLDPFEEYPDDVLYKALEDVELKDSANIINKLDHHVMDRGSNYSVGQRQLICLARAIIRKNKVLLLDEATANVDPQTDALIQKTIRHKFADCTVLTIAHRLNTIMDSNKVMVMDRGTIVEFDHPKILLDNTEGLFYQMVQGTGSQMAEQLMQIARNCYIENKSDI